MEAPCSHKQFTISLYSPSQAKSNKDTDSKFFKSSSKSSPLLSKSNKINEKLEHVNKILESDFALSSTLPSVPDTMEEIYKFSNANRKRNKEKKKMKGDSAKLDSQSAMDANDLYVERNILD